MGENERAGQEGAVPLREAPGAGGPDGPPAAAGPGLGRHLLALLVLAGLTAVFHYRQILHGEIPRWPETCDTYEPLRAYSVERLQEGRLALWNPRLGLGVPTFAFSDEGSLYPLNLLSFRLFGMFEGEVAGWVARTFLAGVFTYALAQALGMGLGGSLLAAAVFQFNAFHTVHKWLLPSHGMWIELPLMVLAAERLVTRRRPWTVVWASLVFGVSLLAGHYQLQFISMLFYGFYGAWRAFQVGGGWRRLAGQAVRLAVPVAAGFALAAVQVWATAEVMPLGPRGNVAESGYPVTPKTWLDYPWYRTSNSFPPHHLMMYVFPFLYQPQDEWIFRVYRGSSIEVMAYVGLLPLVLAPLAWRRRRRVRAVVPLAAGTLVFTLLSFGRYLPGYEWLLELPGFGWFVYPTRYTFPVALCLGLLAGLGVEAAPHLERAEARRWARRLLADLVAVVGATLIVVRMEGLFLGGGEGKPSLPEWTVTVAERLVMSLPAVGVSLSLAVLMVERRLGAGAGAALAVVVAAADLMSFWFWFPRYQVCEPVPPRVLAAPGATIEALRKEAPLPNDGRVAGEFSTVFMAGYRMLPYGIPMLPRRATWVNDLNQWPYDRAAHLFRAFHVRYYFAREPVKDDRLRLIHRGPDRQRGVIFGAPDIPWNLYEVKDVLPRAVVVDRAVWALNGFDARVKVEDPAFDAGQVVVLEGTPPADAPATARADAALPGTAHIESDRERSVRIRVSAERPAWLVLSDLNYPGWTATVNGARVPVYQANYVCRAVRVPAGESVVEYTFRPASWQYGRWVSAGTLGILMAAAGVVAVRRVRRRRGRA